MGRLNEPSTKWLNHAYDDYVCGHSVLVVTPDGYLWDVAWISPIDRWRTDFKVVAWNTEKSQLATFVMDEYEMAMVL